MRRGAFEPSLPVQTCFSWPEHLRRVCWRVVSSRGSTRGERGRCTTTGSRKLTALEQNQDCFRCRYPTVPCLPVGTRVWLVAILTTMTTAHTPTVSSRVTATLNMYSMSLCEKTAARLLAVFWEGGVSWGCCGASCWSVVLPGLVSSLSAVDELKVLVDDGTVASDSSAGWLTLDF